MKTVSYDSDSEYKTDRIDATKTLSYDNNIEYGYMLWINNNRCKLH